MTRGRLLLSTLLFVVLGTAISAVIDDRSWPARIVGALVAGVIWFFLMAAALRVRLFGRQSDGGAG